MVYTLIEHFLNEDGKQFFPEWVTSVQDKLANYVGFLSLEQVYDVEDKTKNLLLLQFDTVENLRNWASSDAHRQILQKLQPFMVKKQHSKIFSNLKNS